MSHLWHVIVFGVPLLAVTVVLVLARPAARTDTPPLGEGPGRSSVGSTRIPWRQWATHRLSGRGDIGRIAAFSMVGAAVHASVVGEHFDESITVGVFFALLAILQASYAALVWWRPTRGVVLAGIAGAAATMLLWAVSRTVGVPFLAGQPETAGRIDLLADLAEIGVLVSGTMAMVLPVTRRQHAHS